MKRVGPKVYIHRSALGELNAKRRRLVKDASRTSGVYVWDIARIDTKTGEVMLGQTQPWDKFAHPQLMRSWRVRDGKVTKTDYRLRKSRPVYHRKDSMVGADHPQRAAFAALTAAEADAGLLGRSDIGTSASWDRALAAAGYKVVGHKLVKARGRGRGAKRTKNAVEVVPIRWVKPTERTRNPGNLASLEGLFSLYEPDEWPDGLMPVFVLSDGSLLDGHHRLEAAKADGRSGVIAVIADQVGFETLVFEKGWPRDAAFQRLTGWEWPMSWTGRGSRGRAVQVTDLSWLLLPPGAPLVMKLLGEETGKPRKKGLARFKTPLGSTRYVWYIAGEPVAGLQVMSRTGYYGVVANVWTDPSRRRRGYARRLLVAARKDFPGGVGHSDVTEAGAAWRDAVEKGRGNALTTVESRIVALLPDELTWRSGSKSWPAHNPAVVITETSPSLLEPGKINIEIRASSLPFHPRPNSVVIGAFAARLLPKGKEQKVLERSRWLAEGTDVTRAVRARYDCTTDWRQARRAGVKRLAHVTHAHLETSLRNRGLGRIGYDALLAWAAQHGAALAPARCIGLSTSFDADRVWKALTRDYPSAGTIAWLPGAVGGGQPNREPYRALVATDYYGSRRARRIAVDLKVPTTGALKTASKGLAEVLFRQGVKDPILVPVPSSSGSVSPNTALARATAARLHARWKGRRGADRRAYVERVVVPGLERLVPVAPANVRRRAGQRRLRREDHVFEWGGPRVEIERVYLVDNVLASGATMLAAQGAAGGGTPLVWSRAFDKDWRGGRGAVQGQIRLGDPSPWTFKVKPMSAEWKRRFDAMPGGRWM